MKNRDFSQRMDEAQYVLAAYMASSNDDQKMASLMMLEAA